MAGGSQPFKLAQVRLSLDPIPSSFHLALLCYNTAASTTASLSDSSERSCVCVSKPMHKVHLLALILQTLNHVLQHMNSVLQGNGVFVCFRLQIVSIRASD